MTTTHPSSLVEGPEATYDFADDIDFMGGSSDELQDLINRLVHRAKA